MNLIAQFFISKFEIEKLQRLKLSIRLLSLLALLWILRLLAIRSSGFSSGPSLCMFRNVTGLPCPFCGSTRSVGNILLGEFNAALYLNPLGYVGLAFLVLLFVTPSTIRSASFYLARKWWTLTQRAQILITMSLLALTWVFNAPRMF